MMALFLNAQWHFPPMTWFKSPKNPKKGHEAHSANTKFGMGDYYGTGFKAPIGRMREGSSPGMNPVPLKKLGKPPKSVV